MGLSVVVLFVTISLALQSLALVVPWLLFVTLEHVVPLESGRLLSWLLPGVCFLVVADGCLRFARDRLLSRVRFVLEEALVTRVVRRLQTMPVGRFWSRRLGEWLERVEACGLLASFSVERAAIVFVDGLLACLTLVAVAFWSWRLAFAAVCLIGLVVVSFVSCVSLMRVLVRERRRVEVRARSALVGLLGGMVTARASGVELAMVDDWGPLLRARIEAFDAQERVASAMQSVHAGVGLLVLGVCLAVGAAEVVAGRLDVGAAAAFGLLVYLVLERVCSLMPLASEGPEAWMQLQRVRDLLSEGASVGEAVQFSARGSPCDLVFDRVRFRYDRGSPWVLKDLTVRFESGGMDDGRVVAVVGTGKSTFARLVAGLHAVSDGEITFAGVPLSRFERGELARRCAVVLEESVLFAGTVADNVRLGRAGVGDDEVVEACRVVEVHREVLEMALGYDTPVFDAGVGLSGGQRHRLLLACALAGRPSVLVVDELLMRVDVGSARRILARVRGQVGLTIVLGDRLAAVRYADEIVVLREGRVVERGVHAALIRAGGIYAAMAREQSPGLDDGSG